MECGQWPLGPSRVRRAGNGFLPVHLQHWCSHHGPEGRGFSCDISAVSTWPGTPGAFWAVVLGLEGWRAQVSTAMLLVGGADSEGS